MNGMAKMGGTSGFWCFYKRVPVLGYGFGYLMFLVTNITVPKLTLNATWVPFILYNRAFKT